jgi:hypothetical protein
MNRLLGLVGYGVTTKSESSDGARSSKPVDNNANATQVAVVNPDIGAAAAVLTAAAADGLAAVRPDRLHDRLPNPDAPCEGEQSSKMHSDATSLVDHVKLAYPMTVRFSEMSTTGVNASSIAAESEASPKPNTPPPPPQPHAHGSRRADSATLPMPNEITAASTAPAPPAAPAPAGPASPSAPSPALPPAVAPAAPAPHALPAAAAVVSTGQMASEAMSGKGDEGRCGCSPAELTEQVDRNCRTLASGLSLLAGVSALSQGDSVQSVALDVACALGFLAGLRESIHPGKCPSPNNGSNLMEKLKPMVRVEDTSQTQFSKAEAVKDLWTLARAAALFSLGRDPNGAPIEAAKTDGQPNLTQVEPELNSSRETETVGPLEVAFATLRLTGVRERSVRPASGSGPNNSSYDAFRSLTSSSPVLNESQSPQTAAAPMQLRRKFGGSFPVDPDYWSNSGVPHLEICTKWQAFSENTDRLFKISIATRTRLEKPDFGNFDSTVNEYEKQQVSLASGLKAFRPLLIRWMENELHILKGNHSCIWIRRPSKANDLPGGACFYRYKVVDLQYRWSKQDSWPHHQTPLVTTLGAIYATPMDSKYALQGHDVNHGLWIHFIASYYTDALQKDPDTSLTNIIFLPSPKGDHTEQSLIRTLFLDTTITFIH